MKNYNYIPKIVKIIAKKSVSEDVVILRVKRPKDFQFLPGQFILFSVYGYGEVPLGITSSPNEKKYLEVAIRSIGSVTRKICSLLPGEEAGINGPFGNGFPLGKIKGKNLVLIAGGIGLFPLRSLILFLGESKKHVKSLTILTGARTPERLFYQEEYKDWAKFSKVLTTVDTADDNWKGIRGSLPILYKKAGVEKDSVMLVCGPPVMYQSIVKEFAGKKIAEKDLYFDLERRMKCGIGKCQHCTCGKSYVCSDGPTFSYSELKNNYEAL